MENRDTSVTFTIDLRVYSGGERDLYRAALGSMRGDGYGVREAITSLRPDGDLDVARCVQHLLDPGISPPGTDIMESSAEMYHC
jgi:hypothetical protein